MGLSIQKSYVKLSSLHEDFMDASGLAYARKKQADPNYPERLPSMSRQPGSQMMQMRSGSQDTPLKPRHRKYFNSPESGYGKKGGYTTDRPLGEWPPAYKEAPIGVWGKRPSIRHV